jgi:hypothetical protein
LWEVGFGNGVRKIHSEFNEVPNLIPTHQYDLKSRSVMRRVALQAVFIGLVEQDCTDLTPKPEAVRRVFGLTPVGLARW